MPNAKDTSRERLRDQRLVQAFARLQPHAFGASCGVLTAGAFFLVTAVVLLKGPAEPGAEVGPHLALLKYFLPGYTVSWGGALIGLVSGLILGYVLGMLFASFLNFHHRLFIRVVERGVQRQGLLDG